MKGIKRFTSILLISACVSLSWGGSGSVWHLENAVVQFIELNSHRDKEAMAIFIQQLQDQVVLQPVLYPVLCSALFRYADWGIASDADRNRTYRLAIEAGEKAVRYAPDDVMSHYAYALSCGRIAEREGGLGALDLLKKFESHLQQVLSRDPDFYLAYYAFAMRYRDAPWPMKDEKKAEEYYRKTIRIEPNYLNAYYDLSLLLLRQNRKVEARECLLFVIAHPAHPEWIEESGEIRGLSEQLLANLR
ncbi:MAG: hypothetical protein PHT42_02580 [Thermotogota bacterium]|nr:hypothetical protein [Thermotogota bacterium]